MPSSWGMFKYRAETSIVSRMQSCGSCVVSIIFIKSFVSLMYEGIVSSVFLRM